MAASLLLLLGRNGQLLLVSQAASEMKGLLPACLPAFGLRVPGGERGSQEDREGKGEEAGVGSQSLICSLFMAYL